MNSIVKKLTVTANTIATIATKATRIQKENRTRAIAISSNNDNSMIAMLTLNEINDTFGTLGLLSKKTRKAALALNAVTALANYAFIDKEILEAAATSTGNDLIAMLEDAMINHHEALGDRKSSEAVVKRSLERFARDRKPTTLVGRIAELEVNSIQ